MATFKNDFAKISHHKTSLKGKLQNYIISFENERLDVHEIISSTYILFFKNFINTSTLPIKETPDKVV